MKIRGCRACGSREHGDDACMQPRITTMSAAEWDEYTPEQQQQMRRLGIRPVVNPWEGGGVARADDYQP